MWLAALLLANRMSVVESDEPFAISIVQCERIVKATRFLRCGRHLRNHEANPMPSFGIDNQREAVEVEQGIEDRIALSHLRQCYH